MPRSALLAALLLAHPASAAEPELVQGRVALIREPSAPDAWGGPRGDHEATLSQRVVDYDLHATLDPSTHVVHGQETITWRNRAAVPVHSLYLHLYLNAFESEGTTFAIEARQQGGKSEEPIEPGEWGSIELGAVHQGALEVPWAFVHPDGGPRTDHTVVRFDLPAEVPAGGQTVLDLTFTDHLPRVIARTGWFGSFHLVGQWFPKVGVLEVEGERGATAPRWNCHEFHRNSEFYADFGAYQLEVVVPAGVTVGASGLPSGAPQPLPDGVHHRFHVEDVHDVVFTAWDGFAPALTGSTQVPGGGKVAVEVLAPPEYAAAARATLDTTLESLRWFSTALGTYPYAKVTAVIPPYNALKAGGMEYETFFTTVAGLTPPFDGSAVTRLVTIHEFGHGYFMGLLATNEFEEPFLDEGMNEWLDARMMDGEPLRFELSHAFTFFGLTLPPLNYWIPALGGGRSRYPVDPIARSAWERWSSDSYSQVYSRTQLVMHDLGEQLGPELTAKALRTYYHRWHHRHPSTADLREAFVEAGADRALVERWFEQQVYRASSLDDRIEKLSVEELVPPLGMQPDGGVLDEDARDRQVKEAHRAWEAVHGEAKKSLPGPFPCRSTLSVRRYGAVVPRAVELTLEDGQTERLEWGLDEPWRRWELERPLCVKSARLVSTGTMLLDHNHLDDTFTAESATRAGRSVGLEAAGWFQTIFAVLEAL